jgi:transposase-like protein
MNINQQWCDNEQCGSFGKLDAGNIKVYSHKEHRYYCTSCLKTFSFDRGTFFEGMRKDRQLILDAIGMLVERCSLRAISRIKHCKADSVLHWLDMAGQHAAAINEHFIHSLDLTQVQIDELWTFVKKNKSISLPMIHMMLEMHGYGEL